MGCGNSSAFVKDTIMIVATESSPNGNQVQEIYDDFGDIASKVKADIEA